MGVYIAPHYPALLSFAQRLRHCVVPNLVNFCRPSAKSLVQTRHFLRQVQQGTAASNVLTPDRLGPNNGDQNIDGVVRLLQRQHPFMVKIFCDHFIYHRVPQSFFIVEMVVQSSLRDARGGQNGVEIGTAKARAVNLLGRGV